jgi:hypothetical protein
MPHQHQVTAPPMTNTRFRLIQSMLQFQRALEGEGDAKAERASWAHLPRFADPSWVALRIHHRTVAANHVQERKRQLVVGGRIVFGKTDPATFHRAGWFRHSWRNPAAALGSPAIPSRRTINRLFAHDAAAPLPCSARIIHSGFMAGPAAANRSAAAPAHCSIPESERRKRKSSFPPRHRSRCRIPAACFPQCGSALPGLPQYQRPLRTIRQPLRN